MADEAMNTEAYLSLLRGVYGEKRWIVAVDILQAATSKVRELQSLGALGALCVAASSGVGVLPDPTFAPDPVVLNVSRPNIMDNIRASLHALAHLPEDAVARIDVFDPDRSLKVLGSLFDDGSLMAGRQKYAKRAKAWQDLEDKTTVDVLWEQLEVPTAPHRVVPARLEAMWSAAQELDQGAGTVWSGDSKEGFNGGGEYIRWVKTRQQGEVAAEFFEAHCDEVRIMPFVEGIPCSIHGIVFENYTIALRPCEMLVFRKPGKMRFHYGRAATFWDPHPQDREAMRALVVKVGTHLRETVAYRGAFTIDGIMSVEGFVPTELNPRWGAALKVMNAGLEDLPLYLLHMAVVEGEPVDWKPQELERLLLQSADQNRAGFAMTVLHQPITETEKVFLRYDETTESCCKVHEEDDQYDISLNLGPGPIGGFIHIVLHQERTPRGPSVAPRAVAALRFASGYWNLELDALEPARNVRHLGL